MCVQRWVHAMVVVVAHLLAVEPTPIVHLLASNSHLRLHVAGLCSSVTTRATASSVGLHQVRVLCAFCRVHVVLRTPLDGWSDGTLRRHRRYEASSGTPKSNRPELRTALVARELVRYKVDIAALSETRFSEQDQLDEVGVSYTFFWNGRPGFAIRNDCPVCRTASTIA
ncbi:hypothetical protein SprV_0602092100 [Sparganum proliferum]